MSRKSTTAQKAQSNSAMAQSNQIALNTNDFFAQLKSQCELSAAIAAGLEPERQFLNECIDKMQPELVSPAGKPYTFNDVFFVIKCCSNLKPLILKYLPYGTHKDSNGHVFYARKARIELLPVVKTILSAYNIVPPEGVLEEELERINKVAQPEVQL